jgi:hypothetical protein
MATFAGKMADIEAAQRIIARVTGTQEGHHWVAEAVVAMRIIEDRLLDAEGAEEEVTDSGSFNGTAGTPVPAVPAVPAVSGEPDDGTGISVVHPGLHGVLGDVDDDDGNDVVR